MSGAWGLAINILLPVPTFLLVVLSFPLPAKYKRPLLTFSNRILSMRLVGAFRLSQFLTLVALLLLVSASYTSQQHNVAMSTAKAAGKLEMPGAKIQMLADKWRHDRNFWIALMCFTLWIVLHRFYAMAMQLVQEHEHKVNLEKEVSRLKADSAAFTEEPFDEDEDTKKSS